jgi:hypothetical protein
LWTTYPAAASRSPLNEIETSMRVDKLTCICKSGGCRSTHVIRLNE